MAGAACVSEAVITMMEVVAVSMVTTEPVVAVAAVTGAA